MKATFVMLICFVTTGFAHNSYTGGHSGAPGTTVCASACHGGTGGTLVVTGFPANYQPGQTYRISISHNGGSKIVNFNATTRVGASSTVAGTFTPLTNSVSYTGSDGGVYANPHSIDSASFNWVAPAGGTGSVTFYAAGFQGTTSSSNGQSSRTTLTSTEITTDVESRGRIPDAFGLAQNYPNPFNPTTTITYQVPFTSRVTLTVYNVIGQNVATLVNELKAAGSYRVTFSAPSGNASSGIYLYRLEAGNYVETKKMILLK